MPLQMWSVVPQYAGADARHRTMITQTLIPSSGFEEDIWCAEITTGSRQLVDVPRGFNLRISQVSCTPLVDNDSCRMGVSCALGGRVVPLCAVESHDTQALEFYVPEGYAVEFRVDDLRPAAVASAPKSRKRKRGADDAAPKNTTCRVTLTGTMTATLPPLPIFDMAKTVSKAAEEKAPAAEPVEARPSPKNSPKVIPAPAPSSKAASKTPPSRAKPSPKATHEPPAKRQKTPDSDATIELDTLPRLPSSWAVMSHEQKLDAIKRIRDGHSFAKSSDSEEDEDLDSDDVLGGMGFDDGIEEDEEEDELDMDEEDFEEFEGFEEDSDFDEA